MAEAALLRQINPTTTLRQEKAKAKTENNITRPKTGNIYVLNFQKNRTGRGQN
jgi:hypothetical protein